MAHRTPPPKVDRRRRAARPAVPPRRAPRRRPASGSGAGDADIRDTRRRLRRRARREAARAPRQAPSSAMLPALRVSSACAWLCASTRNCTANSTSTMPPGSCLRSNSPLRLGCAACILRRISTCRLCRLDGVARQAQDRFALGLERGSERVVAGDEARAGQRLMLPCPGRIALIVAKSVEARHQQPARAVGTQPQIGVVQPPRGGRLVSQVFTRCASRAYRSRRRVGPDHRRGTRGRGPTHSPAPFRPACRSR